MIIYTENGVKTCECRSDKPSQDWTGRAEYVIDETKEENAALIEKAKKYAPYFEVITNSNGEIHDIVKTAEKPILPKEEPENVSVEEKIAQLEAQIAEMKAQLSAGGAKE